MKGIKIKDRLIMRAVVVDLEGNPVVNCNIETPDDYVRKGDPISSATQLAGFINLLLKGILKKEQPIPTGGMMIAFDDGNRVALKCRWVKKQGGKPGEREVMVMTDNVFKP